MSCQLVSFLNDVYSINNNRSNITPLSTSNQFVPSSLIFLSVFVILESRKLDQVESSNEFNLVVFEGYMLNKL